MISIYQKDFKPKELREMEHPQNFRREFERLKAERISRLSRMAQTAQKGEFSSEFRRYTAEEMRMATPTRPWMQPRKYYHDREEGNHDSVAAALQPYNEVVLENPFVHNIKFKDDMSELSDRPSRLPYLPECYTPSTHMSSNNRWSEDSIDLSEFNLDSVSVMGAPSIASSSRRYPVPPKPHSNTNTKEHKHKPESASRGTFRNTTGNIGFYCNKNKMKMGTCSKHPLRTARGTTSLEHGSRPFTAESHQSRSSRGGGAADSRKSLEKRRPHTARSHTSSVAAAAGSAAAHLAQYPTNGHRVPKTARFVENPHDDEDCRETMKNNNNIMIQEKKSTKGEVGHEMTSFGRGRRGCRQSGLQETGRVIQSYIPGDAALEKDPLRSFRTHRGQKSQEVGNLIRQL